MRPFNIIDKSRRWLYARRASSQLKWAGVSIEQKRSYRLAQFIGFLTLINVGVFVWQVIDQERQIKEIKDAITNGITTAKAAIDASLKENRSAAETVLKENRTAITGAIDSLNKNAERSLNATLAQGKASLDTSIEMSRRDQRAWVGVKETLPPKLKNGDRVVYLKEGEWQDFGVVITNTGRTPALDFTAKVRTRFQASGETFAPIYSPIDGMPSNTVLMPNGLSVMQFRFPQTTNATKALIEAVTSGRGRVYLFGVITYEDVFRRPNATHHTTFCMFMDQALTVFQNCDTYNDAD